MTTKTITIGPEDVISMGYELSGSIIVRCAAPLHVTLKNAYIDQTKLKGLFGDMHFSGTVIITDSFTYTSSVDGELVSDFSFRAVNNE